METELELAMRGDLARLLERLRALPFLEALAPVGAVTFFVPGVAQPKGSTKAFHRPGMRFPVVTSDNPRLKDWQHQVAAFAGMAFKSRQDAPGEAFVGPVAVRAVFYLKRPQSLSRRVVHHVKKPDVDKLARALKDGLTGIAYGDDSQVVRLHVEKVYATARVGVDVTVEQVQAQYGIAVKVVK